MKRILALIPTLKDDPSKTVQCLLNQRIHQPDILIIAGSKELHKKLTNKWTDLKQIKVIYAKPNMTKCLGRRLAAAINEALDHVHLEDYDYIFKIDADMLIPPDFLKENLKIETDIIGSGGGILLIRVKPFRTIMGGRWPDACAEDTYLFSKFQFYSATKSQFNISPIKTRMGLKRKHPWTDYFAWGIDFYKIGWEPLHIIAAWLRPSRVKEFGRLFTISGYLYALVTRQKQYKFSKFIFKLQIKRLLFRKSKNRQHLS